MSEVFDGTVEVQDGSATTTVLLDGAVFQEGRTTEEMGARLLNQLR